VVSKITWHKVGRITEPGRYMFTFGWLTVTLEDLAIWKEFPDTRFTLVENPPGSADADEFQTKEYHLGAFELPSQSAPAPGD
jgi:hypothetical protein